MLACEKRRPYAPTRQSEGRRVSGRGLLAVVALTIAAAGVLFAGGQTPVDAGPLGGDGEAATETPDPARDDGEGATGATTASADGGYEFAIERVEPCGNFCRNVTAALTNAGGDARRNVTVTTRVYADDEVLWTGTETVGRLDAGETRVSTKRVDVGFSGGLKIRANDGWVTIVTLVESASGSTRFEERRKVD